MSTDQNAIAAHEQAAAAYFANRSTAPTGTDPVGIGRLLIKHHGKLKKLNEELTEKQLQELEEFRRKADEELQALSNPPIEERFARVVGRAYAGCRLENFVIGKDWEPAQAQQAREVLRRLESIRGSIGRAVEAGVGIILCGEPGVGKDHLAAGMMWAAINAKLKCRWTNGSQFAASAQQQFTDDRLEERQWLETWVGPHVLSISDPDGNRTDCPSPNTLDCLYKVIDARIRDKKHTWITINGSDSKTWVARLSARVWDRLIGNSWLLHCNWPGSRKPRGTV